MEGTGMNELDKAVANFKKAVAGIKVREARENAGAYLGGYMRKREEMVRNVLQVRKGGK